jgi:hypothetical protein
MIPTLTPTLPTPPNPAPLGAPLEVGITPPYAGGFLPIIAGASIGGSSLIVSDLHGLAGYTGRGGILVMPSYGASFGTSLRGTEDGDL